MDQILTLEISNILNNNLILKQWSVKLLDIYFNESLKI